MSAIEEARKSVEKTSKEIKSVAAAQKKTGNNADRRFFNPALTIDRDNQEVLVGIPAADPTFEKGKYKLNETIWIISSKGEKWPLILEQM